MRAAQGGSSEAFGKLHRRFVALVHGVLLSRFRPAVAEELTQECFLIAFRKLPQLRDPGKIGAWLVAIARHVDSDDRVQQTIEPNEDIADTSQDPEASADATRVLAIIRTLPPAYRETLVLRLVEGMSGAEIAAAIDMTPESVRINLHRGMKKLRDALHIEMSIINAASESS